MNIRVVYFTARSSGDILSPELFVTLRMGVRGFKIWSQLNLGGFIPSAEM